MIRWHLICLASEACPMVVQETHVSNRCYLNSRDKGNIVIFHYVLKYVRRNIYLYIIVILIYTSLLTVYGWYVKKAIKLIIILLKLCNIEIDCSPANMWQIYVTALLISNSIILFTHMITFWIKYLYICLYKAFRGELLKK